MNVFLRAYLLDFVETARHAGRLKRFFFIRYGLAGQLHLRLRLLALTPQDALFLEQRLQALVDRYAAEACTGHSRCMISRESYDRTLLYFGDTMKSVYAELLNEQTSRLALTLLRTISNSKSEAVITTGCVTFILMRAIYPTEYCLMQSLTASLELADKILNTAKAAHVLQCTHPLEDRIGRTVAALIPVMGPQLSSDPAVRKVQRLIPRANRCARGIAVHAIHLFCNKVGLGPADERVLFAALTRLVKGEIALDKVG